MAGPTVERSLLWSAGVCVEVRDELAEGIDLAAIFWWNQKPELTPYNPRESNGVNRRHTAIGESSVKARLTVEG